MAVKDKPVELSPEPEPVSEQLLRLVATSTPEDVAHLDRLIKDREADLESLRAVRRVVALRHGLASPSGWKGKKEKGVVTKVAVAPPAEANGSGRPLVEVRREKIVRHLHKHGPTTGRNLMDLFDIPDGSRGQVLDHAWFRNTGSGYELTELGKKAAALLPA